MGSTVEVSWKRNLYVGLFGSFSSTATLTLLIPFLPIYVKSLGVSPDTAVVQWSAIAFSSTFLAGRAHVSHLG